MRLVWASFIAAGLLAMSSAASAQGSPVTYKSEEGFGGASVTVKAWLYRPNAPAPAPAVILLHHCTGVEEGLFEKARTISGWGYVVIVPDSFASRGKGSVCIEQSLVTPGARLPDVIGAAEFLASQPFVRRDSIALIGYSHGANTVLDALQMDLSASGIRGGIAFYPVCDVNRHRSFALPTLILIGEKDTWTPAERCRAMQKLPQRRPDLLEVIYYPRAGHSFDFNRTTRVWGVFLKADGTLGPSIEHVQHYDRSSAIDADERSRAFFAKILR